MTSGDRGQAEPPAVIDFLSAVAGFGTATVPSFSFVATRENDRWEIFRSRLSLNLYGSVLQPVFVKTRNVFGGRVLIDATMDTICGYIRAVLDGEVQFGDDTLYFPPNDGGGYISTFSPLHTDGIAQQNRLMVLQITGGDPRGILDFPRLDWELKAAIVPYDSLADLLGTLGLPILPQSTALFEAVAFSIAAINNISMVSGTTATLSLRLMRGLTPTSASVGYRVMSSGTIVARGRIEGRDMTWSKDGEIHVADASVEVPPAAVVHAYACYDGNTYHHWWFGDPDTTQNPRRAAYEASDRGLEALRAFLTNSGKQSKDFEFGVSWLLWMLGFSSAHLGANSRMSDAADLLVATPQGNLAVVECTTGVLKADHKLTLLVDRTTAVKTQLQKSNYPQARVMPVIFTAKTREEVRADLDQAFRLGIVVITGDELKTLIDRTMLLPAPDAIYTEAEQSLFEPSARAKLAASEGFEPPERC